MSYFDDSNDNFDDIFSGWDSEAKPFKGVNDAGKAVTAPTRVFRIEMPDGAGPWSTPDCHNRPDLADRLHDLRCDRLAQVNWEQMGVTEQAFRKAHGHADYGCDSLEALGNWFPADARAYLARRGARAIEYEIPAGKYLLTVGSGEVVFDRHSATKIATLDVVTLKPICAELEDA